MRAIGDSNTTRRRAIITALIAIGAAGAIALGAGGCGKKKKEKGLRVSETEQAQHAPKPGGHIKIDSTEPKSLNPVLQDQFERATSLIFESLVGLDAKLEPVPRLATKWTFSEDSTTLTFNLRKDVKWHDGKPFTANDVKFTFEAIRGVKEQTVWKAYMESIESLTARDDHTVEIKYVRPYAQAVMTWTVGILPAHVFADGELTAHPANLSPVGTGPFKFTRWEKGKRIVLAANESWWHGPPHRPYLDSIEVVVDVPESQRIGALRTGQLDFTEVEDITAWTNEAQLPDFIRSFETSDVIEPRFRAIAWNMTRELYADKRVRHALTYALDRNRVIDDVLLGKAQPISAPLFPSMFGSDRSIAPRPFDLAKAASLLDESGHPIKDGKRFSIDLIVLESRRGPETDNSMAIFISDLRKIGVELKVTYLGNVEFFARARLRDFDAIYFGWVPDIPDPDPFVLLHTTQVDNGFNFAGITNPDVDDLLVQARSTSDRDKRRELYAKLHSILSEEVPYTALYSPYSHYAWNRRLRGVNPVDISSQPRFPGPAHWWVSQ